jgi:2-dehydropantoate 2-reductase
MGALGGMLTGDVLSTPQRRKLVADVIAEGARVAAANGVRLPPILGSVDPALMDDPSYHATMERVLQEVAKRFGSIRSVTWRDFELGRTTEIDAVTGEIVRRGERSGVQTPRSAAVYRMLKEIESGARSPDPANLQAADAAAE